MDSTRRQSEAPEPIAQWELVDEPVARRAPAPRREREPYLLPGEIATEVRRVFLGTALQRDRAVENLTKAAEAYDRHRYEEALRLAKSVADLVPGVAAVRELAGLAAYRAERWNLAKAHLTAHFTITEDPEHLPVVMDCDRAARRFRAVEKTFGQLEDSGPSAEVLAEGRIVLAATWADQRRYAEAIELLTRAGGAKTLRNPGYRHLRLWYALADVYDRSGDHAAARDLFARVVVADPEAYDAVDRLRELGAFDAPKKNRKRRHTSVSKKKVD